MSAHPACDDWLEAISGYLDGELDRETVHRVHAHLRTCPGCSELLIDLVPLQRLLREWPAPEPPRDIWPAIAQALRDEPRYASSVLVRWPNRKAMGWAVASVAVLALGTVVVAGLHTGPKTHIADVDLYWHQHELYAHEQGEPTLYAPELSAIEASYRLPR